MKNKFVYDLEHIFTYHPATEEQLKKYVNIRTAAKKFAQVLLDNSPECQDQTVAIRKLREVVATINAAIALEGRLYKKDDEQS